LNNPDRKQGLRKAESFGVPWEAVFGYEQAIEQDGVIYLSGQLSHDMEGKFVAPAPLDAAGRPSDFSNMEAQIRRTYENARHLLARYGATLDDVVEEVVYVMDMPSAFHAAAKVRKEMYGKDRPQVANSIVAVSALALPEQLVEISYRAIPKR
jgi:enamine deaminase RidA (YjgF/YER057c/UK114 family)